MGPSGPQARARLARAAVSAVRPQVTGAMAIADVGQDTVVEVNFLQPGKAAGRNFGWNRCEGAQAFPATTAPAAGSARW